MKKRNYLFIVNPEAGSGHAQQVWPQLRHWLNEQQLLYSVHFTQYPHHEYQLAQELAHYLTSTTILVVVGGDGTLHETLNGLHHAGVQVTIGYIPCGSGNDFARGANIPADPLAALQKITTTTDPTTLDIGVFYEKTRNITAVFTNNLGIGFDARVVHQTNRAPSKKFLNKVRLGISSYVLSAINAFFRQRAFQLTATIDGKTQTYERAFLVTTTNHPYFGGGVPIMPLAKMNDGKLDLVIIEKKSTLKFIWLFITILLPGHRYLSFRNFHHFQANQIDLSTTSSEFGQADGEVLNSDPFNISFTLSKQQFLI